jgi:hypothetical protein
LYYYYIRGIDVHLVRYDINITVSIKDLRQSSRFITISIDSILAGEGKLRRYGEAYIPRYHSELHTCKPAKGSYDMLPPKRKIKSPMCFMIGRFWFVVRFCSVYTSAVVQLKKDLAGVKVSLKYLGR